MITQIFEQLTNALNSNAGIALLAAFIWGVLSILLSPCHLSSIPLIIGYISKQETKSAHRSFLISLLFSTGILITIIAIGLLTAAFGRMLGDIGQIGNIIIAVIFIFIGLYLLEIIHFNWSLFNPTKVSLKGLKAAFILGLLFGLGVGPCTFAYMAPILGVIFSLSASRIFTAVLLLVFFTLGHCGVIIGAGTFGGWVQSYLNWSAESRTVLVLKRICGILVILAGIYMMINN
ncbi:MAG: cytochrome c biogenesis protein CcdA [bacterium]